MHSSLRNRIIAAVAACALSLSLFACGSGGYKKNPQPMPGGPYGASTAPTH
jgi:hypothetical protein